MTRLLSALICAIFLAGCACCTTSPTGSALVLDRIPNNAIAQALRENPLEPGKNIKITLLNKDADCSYQLVQIRDKERLHRHNTHDVKVLLWRGKGAFLLGDKTLALKEGDLFEIPRGTPHAYTNEAGEPTVAVARFTPSFDGKDTEYTTKQ